MNIFSKICKIKLGTTKKNQLDLTDLQFNLDQTTGQSEKGRNPEGVGTKNIQICFFYAGHTKQI